MSMEDRTDLTLEWIEALSDRMGENEIYRRMRRNALNIYGQQEIPDRVKHLWRYSDPLDLLPGRALDAAGLVETPAAIRSPFGSSITLYAGHDPIVRLSEEAVEEGVQAVAISQSDLAAEMLGRAVPPGHGLFEALNAAAYNTSLVVLIPEQAALADPIHVIVNAEGTQTLPRILVLAGANSEATIIEEHIGGGEGHAITGVTELFGGQDAMLQYAWLNNGSDKTRSHTTVRARLDRGADLLLSLVAFGGGKSKLDIGSHLDGVGARSEIVGAVLGDGRQLVDTHTVQDHHAAHSWSNIDFKTVLFKRAHAAYTGLIRIDENGKGSEAFQENRNLLLSKKAKADTIPELEILTDDVQCSHGATVAPIDREQVFYLNSRGISERDALHLIVDGFLTSTIERMPEGLQEMVLPSLTRRFAEIYGDAR